MCESDWTISFFMLTWLVNDGIKFPILIHSRATQMVLVSYDIFLFHCLLLFNGTYYTVIKFILNIAISKEQQNHTNSR